MSANEQTPYLPPSSDLMASDNEDARNRELPMQGSPLSPRNLSILFTNPTRYFSSQEWLSNRFEILLVAWLAGVMSMQERIDGFLYRMEGGEQIAIAPIINDLIGSWPAYFTLSFIGGTASGVILWFITGWWYHARLELCGATDIPIRQACAAWQYQNLIQVLPWICLGILLPLKFSSYDEFWYSGSVLNDWFMLSCYVFSFWSCVTSYRAALTFPVSKGKAMVLFLILPAAFYTYVLGVVGTLSYYLAVYF
ncbi:hypothetical protein [Microbulbifer hainanensis]|uniref:hypothetical protein n=1 Tax=Microbulbifer hainanensis TaxID=2735675 RepID=UPI00186693DD|nr:hypothetical protein [Microbulbifer hainanensis]